MRKLTTDEFLKRAIEKHGSKYDYSKVNYVNAETKVCIICPKHGEFWQRAYGHFSMGCQQCANLNNGLSRRKSTEEFVERAIITHGNRYNYSKVNYTGRWGKVVINCDLHGDFTQAPANHLSGQGCPKCGETLGRFNSRDNILRKKFEGLAQPEDYKIVPLTKGKFAKVDNEDFDKVKDINWNLNKNYSISRLVGLMHRFIMNPPDNMVVDHINGDGLDNRRCNLRLATQAQNRLNSKPNKIGSSKYKGVYYDKSRNKWYSEIKADGKKKYLGRYDNEEEAGKAYDVAALKYFKVFAYLNFPELKQEYLNKIKEENG